MESEKCRVLLCAIDKGSITAAAETMGYTISGVSRMMAALENEVGFPLLRRGREGVSPTRECLRLLPSLREMVAQAEQCRQMAGELRGVMSGTVAIGTFSSVATHWLPNMIGAFQKDYPGIDYELLLGDYDEVERWIEDGRVDCGVLRTPKNAALDKILLKNDEYKLVLPLDHPLAALDAVPAEALNDVPFLLLERGGARTEVTDLLERSGVHPKIRFTTWEDFAVMAMAEKGMGVGILPDLILRRVSWRIAVRPLQTPYYRPIYLVMKDRTRLPPAVQKFLDYLKFREPEEA